MNVNLGEKELRPTSSKGVQAIKKKIKNSKKKKNTHENTKKRTQSVKSKKKKRYNSGDCELHVFHGVSFV